MLIRKFLTRIDVSIKLLGEINLNNETEKMLSIEEMLSSCFEFKRNGNFNDFKTFIGSLNKDELQELSKFGYDLYLNCKTVLKNR
jgi:hypothetical protein